MMRLATDDADTTPLAFAAEVVAPTGPGAWPVEADMILSAMDAAAPEPGAERRGAARRPHRAQADLRLYAHDPLSPPIALFTRDVSVTGVGFITQDRLPLGYNGLVRITLDSGETITAACSVYRCRESVSGWFEGALHFATRQPDIG